MLMAMVKKDIINDENRSLNYLSDHEFYDVSPSLPSPRIFNPPENFEFHQYQSRNPPERPKRRHQKKEPPQHHLDEHVAIRPSENSSEVLSCVCSNK